MRSYKQFCGIARALDLVGERWTLLIVRELLPGGLRYTDLLRSLQGITTNLLAKRLQHLEGLGLVERRTLPPPAASVVYELTDRGRALEPALLALGEWGGASMTAPQADERVNPRWFAVSLGRRFHGPSAPFTVALTLGDVPLTVHCDGDRLRAVDGHSPAEGTLEGPAPEVVGVLLGHRALDDAAEVRWSGDPAALERLLTGLR